MRQRTEFLNCHPYGIWKGNNGKYYTYLPDKEAGRVLRKRNTQEEIEETIIEYWKEQIYNPTIIEVFNEWNDRRLALKKIKPSTHNRNKQIMERHYKTFGSNRIKSVDADCFSDFLEEQIAEHNLTAKAFSNLKSVTKGFLKRAKKQKLIHFNVEEMFNDMDISDTAFKKVIKEDYQEVFNDEEREKMICYLMDHLDPKNLGLLLVFVTGIRVGELVGLRHSDFFENTVKIRRTETRYLSEEHKYAYEIEEYPKSDAGIRDVIIPETYLWLAQKIQGLNPKGDYIFVNSHGERMTTNCFRRREERNCTRLGIYRKSPHKIRKTYGSILLDNNLDQRLVIEMMGHSNVSMTEGHYHRNRRSIDKKADILNKVPELQSPTFLAQGNQK